MATLTMSKHVAAAPERVFEIASDFPNMAGKIKGITRVEMLTPGPTGIGTRFKETRVIFGNEASEEMEVVAFEPGKSYELRSMSCGAEFRSLFRFTPDGAGTRVDVEFNTRALTIFAKLMSPLSFLMKGMMRKCLEDDVRDLAAAAEANEVKA